MSTPKLILVLFTFLIFTIAHAQKGPVVNEEIEKYGNTSAHSLVIIIPETSVSAVEKEWKSLMKAYNGKSKTSGGIIRTENPVIKTIGEEPLNILARAIPMGNGAKLSVAFQKNGSYISSSAHNSGYTAAENLVYNFALRTAKSGVATKTSQAQKEFASLERSHKKLKSQQKKLKNNIEKWEKNIKAANRDHENNAKELDRLNKEMNDKIKKMELIKARQKEINKMD